jgi:hypothetical protein
VRNAQRLANVVGVVIADNLEEHVLPTMNFDGTRSADVKVPAVLIHKADADILREAMCGRGTDDCAVADTYLEHQVNVAFSWTPQLVAGGKGSAAAAVAAGGKGGKQLPTVQWTLFTSSSDVHAVGFKREFAPIAKALGARAPLQVFYLVGDGKKVGCKPWGPFGCEKQCTNNGRYCATDPDGDVTKGLDGADVVAENLRQLCAFRIATQQGAQQKWWAYVELHQTECVLGVRRRGKGERWAKKCGQDPAGKRKLDGMLRRAGLAPLLVNKCIADSGGVDGDVPNTLMEVQLKEQTDAGAFALPTVMIDGAKFSGDLECMTTTDVRRGCPLLFGMCLRFPPGTVPDVCKGTATNIVGGTPVDFATGEGEGGDGGGGGTKAGGMPPAFSGAYGLAAKLAAAFAQAKAAVAAARTKYVPSESSVVTLKITQPAALAGRFSADAGIELHASMFGVPKYGGAVLGQLVYASPGNRDGCKPVSVEAWPKGVPQIALVARGGCPFAQKARNMQAAGAEAMVVFDNVVQSNMYYMGTSAGEDVLDITIPSVFVHRIDAMAILATMCEGTPPTTLEGKLPAECLTASERFVSSKVWARLAWGMPHANDRVRWAIWTSSIGSGGLTRNHSLTFEREMMPVAHALGDRALLTAHYIVQSGRHMGCAPHFGSRDCSGLCTNHGRYCAPDPDGDKTAGLSGTDVVRENLRQLCVFNVSTAAGAQHKWWRFVNLFSAACAPGVGGSWETRCKYKESSELTELTPTMIELTRQAGVDVNAVAACIKSSGGVEADSANELLQEQVRAQTDQQVWSLDVTTLTVNGVKFRGNLRCQDPDDPERCAPLEAICAGFAPMSKPPICGGGDTSVTYRFFKEPKSWRAAENACLAGGGHLARISSPRDNERVYSLCGGAPATQRCWIGLTDSRTEGHWVWADHHRAGRFLQWALGEPNNGGVKDGEKGEEDCAYIHGPGYAVGARKGSNWANKRRQWGDHACGMKMPFVCQYPSDFVHLHQPLSWPTAELHCTAMGGHLASVQVR